jgi:formylglycine-generating enzyme required for sulfatase activity
VTGISWADAVVWCNAYSEMAGLAPVYRSTGEVPAIVRDASVAAGARAYREHTGYRLPTEAEWEYAVREGGGEAPAFDAEAAWYRDNAEGALHPVGTRAANVLGLYDLSGNVWEFCWDVWSDDVSANDSPTEEGWVENPAGAASGTLRVTRGGSWKNSEEGCGALARNNAPVDFGFNQFGFRVVR